MKSNLIKYLVPVLFVIPFFTSCNDDPEEVPLDFNIAIPESWRKVEAYPEGLVYTAERKPVNENDTITPGLFVYKLYFPGYTLNEIYAEVKQMIVEDDLFLLTIREADTTINSINYKKMVTREAMVYIQPVSHDTLYADVITERYVSQKAPSAYYFAFFSPLNQYATNKPVFNGIMGSVTFKNEE